MAYELWLYPLRRAAFLPAVHEALAWPFCVGALLLQWSNFYSIR